MRPDLVTAPSLAAAFAVRSRFVIANGMEEEIRTAFRNRPHLVDGEAGFVRMEVLGSCQCKAVVTAMSLVKVARFDDGPPSNPPSLPTLNWPMG